jgi:hypothetical protein
MLDILSMPRDEKSLVLLDDANCDSQWCVDAALKGLVDQGCFTIVEQISESDHTRGVTVLRPWL